MKRKACDARQTEGVLICSDQRFLSDEEMRICLLESDLNMSKSHANVVGFDENVSYLSTRMNLHKRGEHFFMNETAIELTLEFLAFKYN